MRWTYLLLLAACGGGSSSDPATEEQAREFCREGCEHRAPCSELDVESCTENCVPNFVGFRADGLEQYLACALEQPCEASSSGCLAEVSILDEHRAFAAACMEKFVPCGAPANYCELDDDDTPWVLYPPVVMEAIIDCANLPCGEQGDCLEAVEDEYGLDLSAST